jgi:hypothetical protein
MAPNKAAAIGTAATNGIFARKTEAGRVAPATRPATR